MTVDPYQLFEAVPDADFQALKADIALRGVLVPVEVDEHGTVLDGHHRLRAVRELQIKSYPRVVRAGLSEDEKLLHVRALNLLRRHLTPEDRAVHVRELRRGGWSTRRIARAAGVSDATVRRDLATANGQEPEQDPPDRVTGADGRSYPARRRTPSILAKTAGEQSRAQAALRALDDAPARLVDLRRAERLVREQRGRGQEPATPAPPAGAELHHLDFRALPLAPGSVDLIFTDPPYARSDMPLWDDLAERAAAWLRPGGLLVAYCGQMHLPQALTSLTTHLDYWWTLASVHDGSTAQVRQRGIGCGWRPVLVLRNRPVPSGIPPFTLDVARGRRSKQLHPYQQSVAEAEQWIGSLSRPGHTVVDPFLGSGTTAVAAVRLGRRFVGSDADARHVRTALRRLASDEADVCVLEPAAAPTTSDAR